MEIWILGAGRFGALAMSRLMDNKPRPSILVVDNNEHALLRLGEKAMTRQADGPAFLAQHLGPPGSSDNPDWIVPAMGVHVVFEWLKKDLEKQFKVLCPNLPQGLESMVPNPTRGREGALYMSIADFLCPADCPAPADHCTKTGQARTTELDRLLSGIQIPGWSSVVVKSRQMAPGVGGMRPKDLFAARNAVLESKGLPIMLSTACMCHGVANGIEVGQY